VPDPEGGKEEDPAGVVVNEIISDVSYQLGRVLGHLAIWDGDAGNRFSHEYPFLDKLSPSS
jgi:hypothetical protein